jgi:hypothetical protein
MYAEHLPLYVSADALLEAVHVSYDTILLELEREMLVPDLSALLTGMRERLAEGAATSAFDDATRADVDVYLAVAQSLLDGAVVEPVAGGDAAQVQSLHDQAVAASGMATVPLFGVQRMLDFSQYTPRGHYTGEGPELEQYFRAMMWLGRVDMRLIETLPDGSQIFRPGQYRATLLIDALAADDTERWSRIDETVRTFVGESDSMVLPEVSSLIEDLGGLQAALAADDDAVAEAIVEGDYGAQQIASHLMVNDDTVKTLPLNRSFLLFGQRYVVDSHVLSETSYDRIPLPRLMPSPLDAAFAALGNEQALSLLQPELDEVEELPGALGRMRVLVDAHDDDFWDANFYNLWLEALRALSPGRNAGVEGMPEVARTEAFGRRVLNTQLASWAQLRHDTLLYAKQSYTGIPACEFPDVYVDPYPAFFGALRRYAEQGQRIVELAMPVVPEGVAMRIATYFDALQSASATLGEMAERQLRGEPFTEEQMAFINRTVRVETQSVVCASIEVPDGWYAQLFVNPDKSLQFDPTIADVHTQPADGVGNIVGRVLHAGTGYPRMMVVTVDTCDGPRAYVGVVHAYHEEITEDFERLTDEVWATRFENGGERPGDLPWMGPVLAP